MSNTILEFENIFNTYCGNMSVTAFSGGYGYRGRAVQFTIGDSFYMISESEVKTLISALQKRLNSEEGYRATD